MLRKIVLVLLLAPLMGCVHEVSYRGVPAPQWKKLTAEQKQLIVDQAYEDEMGNRQ